MGIKKGLKKKCTIPQHLIPKMANALEVPSMQSIQSSFEPDQYDDENSFKFMGSIVKIMQLQSGSQLLTIERNDGYKILGVVLSSRRTMSQNFWSAKLPCE